MVDKPILLISNTKHYVFMTEGFNFDILVAHPFYNFCPKLLGIVASYKDMFETTSPQKEQSGDEIIPTLLRRTFVARHLLRSLY